MGHELGKSPPSVTGCRGEWSSTSTRPSFFMTCTRHAILSIRSALTSGLLSPDVIVLGFATCNVLRLLLSTVATVIILTLNRIIIGGGVSFRNVCNLNTGGQCSRSYIYIFDAHVTVRPDKFLIIKPN